MVKQKLESAFGGLLLVVACASINALDPVYKNAAEAQMVAEDQALDTQIQETILKIQNLHAIKQIKSLHLSPQQTRVRLNGSGDCVEVDAHSDNHEMPVIKSGPIDYKLQNIHVCFAQDKLTRIESAFTAISQAKREKTVNRFTHRDPAKTNVNDIVLSSIFNERQRDNLRVGDLQNSYTNPMRISFKKDYYLPHLKNTAYILQRTFDLHRHEAIKANTKTVNQYLNYTEQ